MVNRRLHFFTKITAIIVMLCVCFISLAGSQLVLAATAYQNVAQYTVKSGDTLYTISRMFGIMTNDLKISDNMKTDMLIPGQVLVIPAKPLKSILAEKGINPANAPIEILVDKSDHTLAIVSNGKQLKLYHVELGDGGLGDKQIEGDHKTPEGTLYVCEKSVLNPADEYLGTRWMRLSYPSAEDAQRGLNQGLINSSTYNAIVNAFKNGSTPLQYTTLGGGVGIHGGSTPDMGKDWTWGCVGLSNKDVEDFYDFVKVGTKVTIQQ